jgi:polysaccharide export outer membrane protein
MRQIYLLCLFFVLLLMFTPSCKLVYPGLMFQQGKYQSVELQEKLIDQYVIHPYDQVTVAVYSRDGFKLIDVLGGNNGETVTIGTGGNVNNGGNRRSGVDLIVDKDGYLKIPVIGELNVKGYTETELERLIAERMSAFVVSPFVEARVTNRRCFLFKGFSASVVNLNNVPTSLFEVIARSGGIGQNIKAYKIKIIRGNFNNPQIFVVDLSTIEGMQKANLIVQTNDIIYMEPRRQYIRDILRETSIIFTIVNSVTSFYLLGKGLSGN